MGTCIALLRGINVGKAKRVPMAELRTLLMGMGFTAVRTLLNSGNALFETARPQPKKLAASIATAIQEHFGFPVPVIVVTARELDTIAAENPLTRTKVDPSRLLVAFFADDAARKRVRVLIEQDWQSEAVALGSQAAYLACTRGIIDSPLAKEFARLTKDAATTRNWTTVCKLQTAGVEA